MSTNRPQDVADILEGMSSPTPNEVYEATRQYDNAYISAAAASKAHAAGGGGGGSAPVTCVLARDNTIDVHDTGDHPILWDGLYDNYAEFNSLLSIPTGLGLDFDFDGSGSTITTTAAGVWTFTFLADASGDANWTGRWNMGLTSFLVGMEPTIGVKLFTSATFGVPSGTALDQKIVTGAPADDEGFGISNAYLFLTRHG